MPNREICQPVIRIQFEDFDIGQEISSLTSANSNIGAVVSFSGICRDEAGQLEALELEHYPGMAEAEILRIAERAATRWSLSAILVIHRVGKISPGENIVVVLAASTHRQAAFDGASYLMDFLKSRAPFWKKEHRLDGSSSEWVDAKESDSAALEKWK